MKSQWAVYIIIATLSIGLIGILSTQNIYLKRELHKAQVCNKVFVLYLKHNYGLHINLDRLYEDGKTWVDQPEYQ